MANIILFTDRTPLTQIINGEAHHFERYSRPAGAYKVATTLRKQGYTVTVIPNCMRLSLSAIKRVISNNSQDLIWVGLSTTFFTIKSKFVNEYRTSWLNEPEFVDLTILNNGNIIGDGVTQLAWGTFELNYIAEYLKQFNSQLVLGGTWVTQIKDGSLDLNKTNVKIITGQSEDYIVDFTHALRQNQAVPFQLTSTGEQEFKFSSIDYLETDYVSANEWLSLEISRGCSFKCAYCNYDHKGKSDTTKNVRALRDELIRNYEQWGVTNYHLLDDLYNDSEYKIKMLYDEVWSKLPFTPNWVSYLRLDLIWSDPESAKWIEASGCKLGSFGIETLHNVAGRKVGKGLGKERILETLTLLKDTWQDRVLVNALMIAGLPHEPYEHIVETIDWIQTTDLIDSYWYQPLWVTPPDHRSFVLQQNDMSQNYEKYELTWGPDGWINNVGVTFKSASELAMSAMKNRYNNSFPVDLQEYPELRTCGFTHEQLADKNFARLLNQDSANRNQSINHMITNRLAKILSIKD